MCVDMFYCCICHTGPPHSVHDCLIVNVTMTSFVLKCIAGENGGLRQIFHLEVYNMGKCGDAVAPVVFAFVCLICVIQICILICRKRASPSKCHLIGSGYLYGGKSSSQYSIYAQRL